MPLYEFSCPECGQRDERFISLAEFDEKVQSQQCVACGQRLRKVFSVPALVSDTGFMSGIASDDGFGKDERGRKMALEKAKAAGVSVAGKRFHPGLCRRGVMFDPQAWYGSRTEVKKKADALGRNVDGCVTHRTPVRDEFYKKAEAPYECSPDLVKEEVKREIKQKHNGQATPSQVRTITERQVAIHSGRK